MKSENWSTTQENYISMEKEVNCLQMTKRKRKDAQKRGHIYT